MDLYDEYPCIYMYYIYYIFSLHKRLLLRPKGAESKKAENLLGYAFQVLESCLIYYTEVELPALYLYSTTSFLAEKKVNGKENFFL